MTVTDRIRKITGESGRVIAPAPEEESSIVAHALEEHRLALDHLKTKVQEAKEEKTPTPVETPLGILIVAMRGVMKAHGDGCELCRRVSSILASM